MTGDGASAAERPVVAHDARPVRRLPGCGLRVTGGDDGLQLIGPRARRRPRALETGEAPLDPAPVPPPPVLLLEEHQIAVGVGARRGAGGLELHQGQQTQHLGLAGHQLGEHAGEADRLVAEILPHEVLARMGRVTLVEDQVQRREHGRQPRGQLRPFRHLVRESPVPDRPLRAYQALGDRRLGYQERPRDLRRREAPHQPQRERDAAVGGKRGMAAGEDQPEPVVGHLVGDLIDAGHVRRRMRRAERLVGEGVRARARAAGAAQMIEGPPSGRGEEPGARTVRDAVRGPVGERLLEGLLDHLLRRVDVARDPEHRGDHPRVLDPEDVGQPRAHALVGARGPLDRIHGSRWYAKWRSCSIRPGAPADAPPLTSPRPAARRRSRLRRAGSSSPTPGLPRGCRTRSGRSRPGLPSSR